jgi:hypothetical protein
MFFSLLQLTQSLLFEKKEIDSGGGSFSSAGSPIPTSLANRCPNHLSTLPAEIPLSKSLHR